MCIIIEGWAEVLTVTFPKNNCYFPLLHPYMAGHEESEKDSRVRANGDNIVLLTTIRDGMLDIVQCGHQSLIFHSSTATVEVDFNMPTGIMDISIGLYGNNNGDVTQRQVANCDVQGLRTCSLDTK